MTPIDVILAAPALPGEPDLVAAAPSAGVRIVRRCRDHVDLLASASVAVHVAIVASSDVVLSDPGLVARLGPGRVVGLLADPGDDGGWAGAGVAVVVDARGPAAEVWRRVRAAAVPDAPPPAARMPQSLGGLPDEAARGRLVAVWGPSGAPGRTTIAIGLAEAWAGLGADTLLVDADTYAPAAAMALGVVDPGGGILRAARLAESDGLDPSALRESAVVLRDRWHLLAGIGRPDRWDRVRQPERLWPACRTGFAVTVVDVGPGLSAQDGVLAVRRDGLALSALAEADIVVVVADATASGAARLSWAWPDLVRAAPVAAHVIVANRSRPAAGRAWADAVRGLGVPAPVRAVPIDRRGVGRALLRGRSLGEVARRSPVRRRLAGLAPALLSP